MRKRARRIGGRWNKTQALDPAGSAALWMEISQGESLDYWVDRAGQAQRVPAAR